MKRLGSLRADHDDDRPVPHDTHACDRSACALVVRPLAGRRARDDEGAVVRVVIALVLLQIGAAAFGLGIAAAPSLAILMLVGTVVPVLTFTFLASIWFLKVCADQVRA